MLSSESAPSALAPRFTRRTKLQDAPPAQIDDGVALSVKIAKTRRLVHETVIAYRKDFLTAFQYCSNLVQDVEAAFGSVDAEDDEERVPADIAGEIQSLRVLAQLHHILQNFDSLLDIGEFKMAASAVMQMMDLFEQLVDANGLRCDFSIYQLLKNDYAAKRARLSQYLNEMFASGISFQQDGAAVELQVSFRLTGPHAKKYYETSIPLEDVLSAMYQLETLESKLQGVANRVTQVFIENCISNPNSDITTAKSKIQATMKMSSGSGKNKAQASSSATLSLETVFGKMLQICSFIAQDVFPAPPRNDGSMPSETLLDVFGRAWWPSMWKLVHEKILLPRVPESALALKHFIEELRPQILHFGNGLETLGILPPGRGELDDFVGQIEALSVAKRRASLLSTARAILVNEDINMVEVNQATERGGVYNLNGGKKDGGGDQPSGKAGAEGKAGLESSDAAAFKVPRCLVSSQVQSVVEMAYQVVGEAAESSSNIAIELFYCARDLFDLIRCVRPLAELDPAIATQSSALLFHNDCMYVSHHLLTIGYQYKNQLPPPLNETATFVDMVPAFRKLGETALRGQLRTHRDFILEHLGQSDSLRDLNDDTNFERAEKAFKEVILRIDTFSRPSKRILPADMYLSMIGLLVDTFLGQVLQMVPPMEQASWKDSFQVKYIFNLVFARIEKWFELQRKDGTKVVTEKAPISKHVPSWPKFAALQTAS